MNIYRYELRANRRSTIAWTLGLVVLTVFFFSLYPAYASNETAVRTILKGFPPQVLSASGINPDILFTVNGFYIFEFTYLALCGAFQAMNLGLAVLSKETRGRTADFLLTKPVSRREIMTGKLLAAVTLLLLTNIAFIAAATITALLVSSNSFSYRGFLMISLTLIFIQLMFTALGLLISVLIKRIKSVTTISLATVLGLFFIGAVSSASADQKLRYFSPFKYFDPQYIARHLHYETTFTWTALCLVAAAIIVSYIVFIRQDIYAV